MPLYNDILKRPQFQPLRPQFQPQPQQAPANIAPTTMAAPAAPAQFGYQKDVIQRSVRRQGIRTAENARRRMALRARMSGLDPNQARVARLNAESAIDSGLSDTLNEGTLQGALADQQYGRQQANRLQERQWMLQDRQHAEDQQRFRIGPALGSLVGQGIGAFTGGLGARLGAGGQRRQRYGTPLPNIDYLRGAAGY